MNTKDPLWGEERKIISTRVYRSEFANFVKICDLEGKTVNTKVREMIKDEIERKSKLSNETILRKIKEDKENAEEKIRAERRQWNFKIKENKDNV